MPIYDKPVWQLMRDMAKELLPMPSSVVTKDQVLAWFDRQYPLIKRGTIDAHLTRMATNAPNRVHFHGKPGADDLLLRLDPQRFRLYNSESDPSPIYKDSVQADNADEEIDVALEGEGSGSKFAFECDLRDYLARNLNLLETGMRLYEDGEGNKGLEFPAGGRFIDILAVDASGNLVVIELKVSRGYDRVVGQLLRYVNWIRQNLANEGQTVRGIIVAREISDDLRMACAELPFVSTFEYKLSMTLRRM